MAGAFHFLFAEKDQDQADKFFETLASGVGLNVGDPIYTLRERLIRERGADRKVSRLTIMAFTIKAWNAFRGGKQLMMLKYSADGQKAQPFPQIE